MDNGNNPKILDTRGNPHKFMFKNTKQTSPLLRKERGKLSHTIWGIPFPPTLPPILPLIPNSSLPFLLNNSFHSLISFCFPQEKHTSDRYLSLDGKIVLRAAIRLTKGIYGSIKKDSTLPKLEPPKRFFFLRHISQICAHDICAVLIDKLFDPRLIIPDKFSNQ